jgi:hypothetical protein
VSETKLQKITKRARVLYEQNREHRNREASFDFATEQACKEEGVTDRFERIVLRSVISKEFGPYYFPPGNATWDSITECVAALYHFGYWAGKEFDRGIDEAFRQYRLKDEFDRAVLKKLVGKKLGLRGIMRRKKLREAEQRLEKNRKEQEVLRTHEGSSWKQNETPIAQVPEQLSLRLRH